MAENYTFLLRFILQKTAFLLSKTKKLRITLFFKKKQKRRHAPTVTVTPAPYMPIYTYNNIYILYK